MGHNQGNSRIEAEGTSGAKGGQQPWEGQRKDGSPEQVGRDSKGHTNLSMREGEDLSGVGEWHGTFTWRVEGGEQEDKESNETDVSGARCRNVETESGGQEGPGHLGESEQEKGSPSIGIDGSDSRPCETCIIRQFRKSAGIISDIHEVDETETERCQQCLEGGRTSFDEDG